MHRHTGTECYLPYRQLRNARSFRNPLRSGYLPYRQLRKKFINGSDKDKGYLPYRQLRKVTVVSNKYLPSYLPYRQLRNSPNCAAVRIMFVICRIGSLESLQIIKR